MSDSEFEREREDRLCFSVARNPDPGAKSERELFEEEGKDRKGILAGRRKGLEEGMVKILKLYFSSLSVLLVQRRCW